MSLFPLWRDLWYAHAIHKDGRLIDAIYDIEKPQRLLDFVMEYKHSITIEIYRRPTRKRGMPRNKVPSVIHVASYDVESKLLSVYADFELLGK
jgi:hypothetical protein